MKNRFLTIVGCICLLVILKDHVVAQYSTIDLTNLNAFTNITPNWSLASDVDVNEAKPATFITQKGTGILVNQPTYKPDTDLFTLMQHGDIDFELEFMMAKNANSGIYLMGNYEIQLFDSWGKTTVTHSDCGGIYERWDDSKPNGFKGYLGVPPRENACKAPGLWQKLAVSFSAPKFENGKKIKNAFIHSIYLNGVLVQQNVELSGVTRGNLSEEKPTGPLRLQGDHGSVAFKNIKYKSYSNAKVYWNGGVSYRYFEQAFDIQNFNYQDFKPTKTGNLNAIDYTVSDVKDKFATQFTGMLNVPQEGEYTLHVALNGDYQIVINNDTLVKKGYCQLIDPSEFGVEHPVFLKKGDNVLVINYIKNRFWLYPLLGLFVSSPNLKKVPLHDFLSFQPEPKNPTLLPPLNNQLLVSRFFVNDQKGIKVTHPASVAFPSKLNFTVDTEIMALFQAWRGSFLDMNNAWVGRGGESVVVAGGPCQSFPRVPALAVLTSSSSEWPVNSQMVNELKYKGFYINTNQKLHFNYEYGKMEVEDVYEHIVQDNSLLRTISVASQKPTGVYVLLAKGDKIIDLKNGKYMMGDKAYILQVGKSMPTPILRKVSDGLELVAPIKWSGYKGQYIYSLIW